MSNYKYQGIELTPAVFKDLLIQFFDGKQFSRQEAVDEIQKYHLENGGLLTKATYLATFKKAAQQLKDAGIENVGYGIWRLRYNTQKFDVTPIPAKSNDFVFSSDKIIGSGCTIGWSKPGLLSIRQNPAPAWCCHIGPVH